LKPGETYFLKHRRELSMVVAVGNDGCDYAIALLSVVIVKVPD